MVLSFVLSLVAAAHHRAAVVHGYCSEHGRPIHLERAELRLADHAPIRPVVERDHQVKGAHGCAHLAFLAHSGSLRRTPSGWGEHHVSRGEPLPCLDPPTRVIPLLHLSPKNSPPA
jgi:hypothetical protein